VAQTLRRTIVASLVLAFAPGVALLLASTQTAVAEPVEVTPLPPVEETDGRAGACYSYYYDPSPHRPYIQMAYDAGSRWDRFDFIWPNLEPSNNVWDSEVQRAYDDVVNSLDWAGIDMIGILVWTPDWAATSGQSGLSVSHFDQRPPGWYAPVPRSSLAPQAIGASSSPPQGLYLAWDDPNNHWGDFVYTVVSRYKDQVKHWEMWNEPEWSYFWTGTSGDYAQLLKVGYQATKAACPDCTVLFGGLHYWANPNYYRWVLGALDNDSAAPSNNYFFDVMSVHLYSRSSSIYNEVNNIRSGMSAYNVGDHPIWLTETGVPVWGDPLAYNSKYDYAATQDEAAAYVIQSYANAWASGVGRYLFFRTHDADMAEYFGLVRNDHSLRPAYVAYQVATTYLISPTFTTRASTGPYLNVALWGTPRGKASVLWNEGPTTGFYTLTAAMPTAAVVDRWGVSQTITATGGLYTFTLSAATANLVSNPNDYIIGGDPLIVIETETPNEPPTSTIHSLPTLTYSPTITVTWEGQDNQSGVWFYDIQTRDGLGGSWTYWMQATSATFGQFTGQHDHTYTFRSRATDGVGNREAWPQQSNISITFDLSSTLHLGIGALFADENRNGLWDRPITATDEITLTDVTLRFVDQAGHDVVSPTVGSGWGFTTTIYAGQLYRLRGSSTDHACNLWLMWPRGGEVYTETYPVLGLLPLTRSYMPLVFRDG
jgi:hypothetical protein